MYWKNFLRITRRNFNSGKKLGKLAGNYQQEFGTAEKAWKACQELPAGIGTPRMYWKNFLGITRRNLEQLKKVGKLARNYP